MVMNYTSIKKTKWKNKNKNFKEKLFKNSKFEKDKVKIKNAQRREFLDLNLSMILPSLLFSLLIPKGEKGLATTNFIAFWLPLVAELCINL